MNDVYRKHDLSLPAGTPLFRAVCDHIPGLSGRKCREAISAGLLTFNGEPRFEPTASLDAPTSATLDLRHGIPNHPHLNRGRNPGSGLRLNILHLDPHVVVIDKPSGILSAPETGGDRGHIGEQLRRVLKAKGEENSFLGLIHRIDKETSGCLCFARTRKAQPLLGSQFATHAAERRYLALADGQPREDADSISGRLGRGNDGRRKVVDDLLPGKEALTRFRVIQRFARCSELELELETGRTHQIRIHLASIGCPVLGDPVYGPRNGRRRDGSRPPRSPRMMLHAHTLAFDHPVTGERITVTAPVDAAFERMRRSLKTEDPPKRR